MLFSVCKVWWGLVDAQQQEMKDKSIFVMLQSGHSALLSHRQVLLFNVVQLCHL